MEKYFDINFLKKQIEGWGVKAAASTANNKASVITTVDSHLNEHNSWSKPAASNEGSVATTVDSYSIKHDLRERLNKKEGVKEKYEKASKSIVEVIVAENERLKKDLETIKAENNSLRTRFKFQDELNRLTLLNADLKRYVFIQRQMHDHKESGQDGSLISDLSIPLGESGPTCNLVDLLAIPYFLSWWPSPLKVLDLSHTSIKTLPGSLTKLAALQKLILRCCELFMELPLEVGEIQNLEVLDLDGTEILDLPEQIGMLSKLKILRVSFYGYMNCGKRLSQNALIHPGTISALSQLTELSIDANPDDERWNAVVETIIEEACSLKSLQCLIVYLPNIESLGKRRMGSTSLGYYPLHSFRFTVGQHKQRTISRVPKEIDAHFREWKRCLKFVKGKDIPSDMKKVLKCTKAFYLDRHHTATSLCDFGIKNMQELEFCLLVECNEIQTIISGVESLEEQADMLLQDPNTSESGGALLSAREPALVNLHYLHIFYLKNLVSIWRTPTNDKQCLSGLKFLALHMCPKLSVIFSLAMLANLGKLEVLIVKDCPEVTCVVSPTSNHSIYGILYLPSLKRILLLHLPKLISISSGFRIAAKLEKVGFYNCPKLESLSRTEMSSGDLKVIKGESKWWEALKWNKSEWGTQLDYIQSIFSPITTEKDVMTQMEEITRIPSSHQTRTQRDSSYSWMASAGTSHSSFDLSQTTTSSRDEPFVSVSNASKTEGEWVEQEEPGIYITIRQLPDGTRELIRVRFSRKRFGEKQAEQWWKENRERVCTKHRITVSKSRN